MPMSPMRLALERWATALSSGLVSARALTRLEDELTAVCQSHPGWAAVAFAEWTSMLSLTLPDGDSWRALSGRLGSVRVGEWHSESDGAVRPDGEPFGSVADLWLDDVVLPMGADPALDLVSVSLAGERLGAAGAGLIAVSARGPDGAREALMSAGGGFGWAGALGAVRWLCARRASMSSPGDLWVQQAGSHAAWMADVWEATGDVPPYRPLLTVELLEHRLRLR